MIDTQAQQELLSKCWRLLCLTVDAWQDEKPFVASESTQCECLLGLPAGKRTGTRTCLTWSTGTCTSGALPSSNSYCFRWWNRESLRSVSSQVHLFVPACRHCYGEEVEHLDTAASQSNASHLAQMTLPCGLPKHTFSSLSGLSPQNRSIPSPWNGAV
jgi:hypothetical protein